MYDGSIYVAGKVACWARLRRGGDGPFEDHELLDRSSASTAWTSRHVPEVRLRAALANYDTLEPPSASSSSRGE
ncbi:hypothetical protein HBB16_08980 [Pseudonocardia sp. MCCB 268]|nr:hypothetical protein [Pseudonocardia cytotoxica]